MLAETASAIVLAQEKAANKRMTRECGEYSTAYMLGVFRVLYENALIKYADEVDGRLLLEQLKADGLPKSTHVV